MSDLAPTAPSTQARTARLAVSLFFFTNGIVVSSLVPHYPGIKAELGLSNSLYGIAIAAVPAGAMIAGPAAGIAVRRFGSAATSMIFTLLGAIVVALVPFASALPLLIAAFFLMGVADSIADVGQNAHGLKVQRAYGRSILNSFHAIWSVGAVTGGALGALAIWLDIPRALHLGAVALIVAAGSVLAYRKRLPGADQLSDDMAEQGNDAPASAATDSSSARATLRSRPFIILSALALLAIGGALIEDSGSTWAAIYLGQNVGASASLASLGFVALVGAQFIGRVLGDGFVDRFGQRAVARAGGFLILTGMGLALAFPSVPLTVLGFALAGFGSATLVPAAFQGADEIPGLKEGSGLTIVSWLLRLGFLLSPPIVGWVADITSLRVGLLVLPLAGLVIIVCASVLSTKRTVRAS